MSNLPVSLTPQQIRACQRNEPIQLIRAGRRGALYFALKAGDIVWIREQFRIDRRFDPVSATQANLQNARPTFAADESSQLHLDPSAGKLRGCRLLPRIWHRYSARVLAVDRLRALDLTTDHVAGENCASVRAWADQWDKARSSFGNVDLWATNPALLAITLAPILAPLPQVPA